MHLIQEALAQKQKKQTFFRETTMAADFTMSGRPSPGSAASAEKIVAVTMACDCCTVDNFADPCTLSSSCKRSRCHPQSLPNKKAIFFSVDDHHAAAGVPTLPPGAARTEESGLLKVRFASVLLSSCCMLHGAGVLPCLCVNLFIVVVLCIGLLICSNCLPR